MATSLRYGIVPRLPAECPRQWSYQGQTRRGKIRSTKEQAPISSLWGEQALQEGIVNHRSEQDSSHSMSLQVLAHL